MPTTHIKGKALGVPVHELLGGRALAKFQRIRATFGSGIDFGIDFHGRVALAACLQVDWVAHNAVLQEQSMGIHYNQSADLLDDVKNRDDFRIEAGNVRPSRLPGLGVEIDEDRVIEASRNVRDWRNPLWRHADGSIAKW